MTFTGPSPSLRSLSIRGTKSIANDSFIIKKTNRIRYFYTSFHSRQRSKIDSFVESLRSSLYLNRFSDAEGSFSLQLSGKREGFS